jgi:hypothetical protein
MGCQRCQGFGVFTAMFWVLGTGPRPAPSGYGFQQGPAAAGTSSSCRHGPALPGVCVVRVVRGVLFDNGSQVQQGTCASRAAATATSCALV